MYNTGADAGLRPIDPREVPRCRLGIRGRRLAPSACWRAAKAARRNGAAHAPSSRPGEAKPLAAADRFPGPATIRTAMACVGDEVPEAAHDLHLAASGAAAQGV